MTQPKSYSDTFAISQSAIKDFLEKSPLQWKKIWIDGEKDTTKDESVYTFGSLLDIMCFTPHELEDKFYITELKLPSENIQAVILNIYNTIAGRRKALIELNEKEPLPEPVKLPEFILDADKELILSSCKDASYGQSWKEDTIVKKIVEEGSRYFEDLVKKGDRCIVSNYEYSLAQELCNILRTDPVTKSFFVPSEGIEIVHQLELHSSYKYGKYSIPIKALLDIVKIDHNKGTVTVGDGKSTQSAFKFKKSIYKYKYDWQLSFYCAIINNWVRDNYPNYKLDFPVNICIDAKDKIPYVYQYTDEDLQIAMEGNDYYRPVNADGQTIGYKYKGWQQVLEDICWHYFSNQWDRPKEHYIDGYIRVNTLSC